MSTFKTFLLQDEGVTALEYGLFAALIAAIIIGTVASIGGKIHQAFIDVDAAL